jgi:hypothetical protein
VLWSRLDLTRERSDFFIKTWLERAKGCALDVIFAGLDSADTLSLLTPRTQQFRSVYLVYNCWPEVQRFAQAASGPLPLLHHLSIHVTSYDPIGSEINTRPSTPLFTTAVNLQKFTLRAEGLPHLDHFAFPSLATLELTAIPEGTLSDEAAFPTSQLLDFLEATPTLQTVSLAIHMETSPVGVPPGRVITLPNVENLHVTEQEIGYRLASHLSCPSAKQISLIREQDADESFPQEAFPASITWQAIPPQYMASRLDAVEVQLEAFQDIECYLSFLSFGSATFQLGYAIVTTEDGDNSPRRYLRSDYAEVFSQACKAIRNHPLLANVRCLRIRDRRVPLDPNRLKHIANNVGRLFKSLGPLDELVLDVSDLQPYLAPFINLPNFHNTRQSFAYPQITGLTVVADQSQTPFESTSKVGILEFARSQQASGVPFEQVVFQMETPPEEMVESLRPWVGTVCCNCSSRV